MFPTTAARFNPLFDQANYTSTNANSWYNAMTLSFVRRPTAGLGVQAGYTWAKASSISDTAQRAEYSGGGAPIMLYAHDQSSSKALSGYHIGQAFNFNYTYDLPFGRGMSGVVGRLLSGWQITGIVRMQSGQPFTITRATPTAGTNAINVLTAAGTRPNRNMDIPWDKITSGTTAGCTFLNGTAGAGLPPRPYDPTLPNSTSVAPGQKLGTPNLYFDPCAFYLPTTRELGNLGKNVLLSYPTRSWDMGISKETSITERWRLQFKAEAFNLMNRANFGGASSSVFVAGGSLSSTTGRISSTNSPNRQMQFSLKLLF
jgi:hypothetical protein